MTSPREVLIEALEDVKQTEVPDDLRQIAFSKTFDLRAVGAAVPSSGAPGATSREGKSGAVGTGVPGAPASAGDGDLLTRIAARLEIDRGTAGEVFTADGSEIEVIVPVGKLSGRTATATKEIALLVAGGRQAADLEEWTSWDEIRKVCADFRKLDSGNFAKTMREMDDVFNTRKQSDRKMLVRLARPGWERLADAVRRLGGVGE